MIVRYNIYNIMKKDKNGGIKYYYCDNIQYVYTIQMPIACM